MEQCTLHLKHEKLPGYNRTGYLIFLLNLLVLGYVAAAGGPGRWYALAGCTVVVLWMLLWQKKPSLLPQRQWWLMGYAGPAISWLLLQQYWVALALAVLALLDYIMRRPLVAYISKNGVAIPALPRKNLLWTDIEFVVLKDGLLTIALLNHKTIQAFISERNTPEEAAFNLMVQKYLGFAHKSLLS